MITAIFYFVKHFLILLYTFFDIFDIIINIKEGKLDE